MTREEAKELLPIIQAFIEGKQIQWLNDCNIWIDADNRGLSFNSSQSRYRIKPEPKYRPFKTREECWEEMHKHPDFGWLKNKQTGHFANIGNISERQKDKKPIIIWAVNEDYNLLASYIFNDYTFTDGTPFGIKEE